MPRAGRMGGILSNKLETYLLSQLPESFLPVPVALVYAPRIVYFLRWFLGVAGVTGALAATAVFAFFYVVTCFSVPKGNYTFEHRGPGSFEPTLKRYTHLVEFIVGLASGSIVLLGGSSVWQSGGRLPSKFGSPLVLLAASVVLLVLFLACTTFFYEDWLHNQRQTHHRYRLSVALGFAGLLCFAVGYCFLAFSLVQKGS